MNDSNQIIPKLDVPYYKETRYSTCGPAALMMVMKYWDNTICLSKNLEYKIWLRCNPLIFLGGTLQFGLARTAHKMGYKTKIYQKKRISEINPHKGILYNFWSYIESRNIHRENITITYNVNIMDIIQESIMNKIPPIVFLNLKPLVGENVLHWLVVTGLDEKKIYVNDPYIPSNTNLKIKKGFPIKIAKFQESIATDKIGNLRLPPCLIQIYR